MASWLSQHWVHIGIPLLVFVAVTVLGLWSRLVIHDRLVKHAQKSDWVRQSFIVESLWNPFLIWFALLGAYVAVEISIISVDGKKIIGEVLASLFMLSLMWTVSRWASKLIRFYIGKSKNAQSLTSVALNITRITIIIIGVLIIFNIWGIPTFPITLIFVAFIFLIVFAFRPGTTTTTSIATVSYNTSVQSAFNSYCIQCHGSSGGVSLSSWGATTTSRYGSSAIVVPGNAASSILYQSVSGGSMSGYGMSAAQVQALANWINQGALNN